jgi:quinol monooxygenase YgiN
MAVYMTAEYRVRPESVDVCLAAIRMLVDVLARTEPGTRHYVAWQDERDPVHFLHHFVFEDESSETTHRESDAVKAFTAALYPAAVDGVHFTRYREIASNHHVPGPA